MQLDKMGGKDVQRCLNEATEVLCPTSVKAINATLRSALSTAIRWRYIDRNVAKNATPHRPMKYKGRVLNEREADVLFNAVSKHRFKAIFYVALMLGLRRGEVAGLRWQDIDLANGRLYFRHSLQRIAGKGLILAWVKTEDSKSNVALPRLCIEALIRRRIFQERERIEAGAKWRRDSDFVFTSRYGARIVIEELTRELNIALAKADLPHIRFQDLRHSTESLLLAKNEGHSADHAARELPNHDGHVQPYGAERSG
jgi:integrase